jgi:gliding motility-associated-like protein
MESKLFLILTLILSVSVKSQAQNCQIIDTVLVTNVSCYDSLTGSIDIELLSTLNLADYSFSWTDPSGLGIDQDTILDSLIATSNIAGAVPYQVIITDLMSGAICDTSFIISQPQDPLSSAVNLLQNVDCYGDSTGAAVANVIGGTTPYSYLWLGISGNSTSQVATTLWAETYHTVIFTDSNGCTLRDSILVSQNDSITDTLSIIQNVSCFNACDGIAELSSSGGVLQHTYLWDNGQTYTGSGPNTTTNLCYGGHSIIIEDALGCRKSVQFFISQPDELFAQAVQDQPVQCYGFDDGVASAIATGGTLPYSFVWDSINGQTGQIDSFLTPGIHTVYVTDSNGCTASDTVVISEPSQLQVIIDDTLTVYSYCAGTNSGQLCAYASGGTPNPNTGYNYIWNDALGQATPCAYNLVAQSNDYTVVVMDDRNCIASVSFGLDSITNSMNPDSVIVDINNVSCFGIYDGSLAASNVVGAVAPFSYTWTGPGGYTGNGSNISSLYAGNYALIVEDHNDCAITIFAQVLEPDQLEYTTYNVKSETCYGACDGQIWVNATGGTGNYYYDIMQSNSFPIPAASQLQLINDSLILNLCEGEYSIYLTDDNNCEGAVVWGGYWQEQVDSGVIVSAPGVLTLPASCFNTNDAQAWVQWPGPNPLFNYTWETTGGVVIDTGVLTSILLPNASYNLVAHYADSASFGQNYTACDFTLPFTTAVVGELLANENVVPEQCFGEQNGSINLSPSSPAGNITVVWDTTTSIPNNSTDLNQGPLQPGVYTVVITDADNCQITEDYIIEEADPITLSISFNPPLCKDDNNGSATVIPIGGTGSGWTYLWSDTLIQTTSVANNLLAGTYNVIVKDNNNCSDTAEVTVTEPDDIIADVSAITFYNESSNGLPYHISCNGLSDGQATVTYGGGVAPYSYFWSPLGGSSQTGQNMSAGFYTVTVKDGNNCTESDTITLRQPEYLDPNILSIPYSTSFDGTTNEISCHDLSDGLLESVTLGGTPSNVGFQYTWVNNNTGFEVSNQSTADNLVANTSYTVTVIDANGCTSTEISEILDEPNPMNADVTTTNYGGATHAPFSVNFVDNTNNIDPFDFNWTWEDGTSYYPNGTLSMDHEFSIDNIGENNVYVTVSNTLTGCDTVIYFIIDVQGIPEMNNVFSPNSDGINDEFYFGEYAMANFDVSIYNRWGQLVSSWNEMNQSWDGKGIDGNNLPEGVYFYVLVAEGADGHYYDYKGSVTLLR